MLLNSGFSWYYFILGVSIKAGENNGADIPDYTDCSEIEICDNNASTIFINETRETIFGSNVLLSCPFETLGGLLNASWYRGEEILTHNLDVISNDRRFNVILEYNLKINELQRHDDDEEQYYCSLNREQYYYYELEIRDPLKNTQVSDRYGYSYYNKIFMACPDENDSVILPCQGIYMLRGKNQLIWEKGNKIIFSQNSEYKSPLIGSKMKIVSGFTLEIQNVQYPDGDTEYICKIQKPNSKKLHKIITHKIVISDSSPNDVNNMCSSSPCGLNTDCIPNSEYPKCTCRLNFKGTPPECEPDCLEDCSAHLACLNENCKTFVDTSCKKNSYAAIQNYQYVCMCSDNYFKKSYAMPYYTDCRSALDYPEYSNIINTTAKTYKGILNNSIILPCDAKYSPDRQFFINWRKQPMNRYYQYDINFPKPRMKIYTIFNLRIQFVKPEDAGYYICRIIDAPLNDITYKLEVSVNGSEIEQPNIKKSITTIRVEENDEVILPCEAVNNLDFKLMDWIKTKNLNTFKKVQFNETRFNIVKGQNLEIQNLQSSDAGIYSCFLEPKWDPVGNISLASHELKILDSVSATDRNNNPCLENSCGENSECYVKNGKPVCSCRPNYTGTPPNCTEHCPKEENCSKLACLSERCENLCKESCELQRNAFCRIESYKWTCRCIDGFFENPTDECVALPTLVENYEELCGFECLLLTIGTPILFLLLITIAIFKITKRRRRKETNYLIDNSTLHIFNRYVAYLAEYYDEKWEFSRERLIIKDFIDEGHSGRVFKAQAIGISGSKGSVLVAVKTLKKNPTDSQLDDLISEYQSLKELNHPNVIRLLGVCTKDGPLYVIMEYAENGSLRCFLQKAKKEIITAPCDKEKIYTPIYSRLQPKSILTFAWQIAKGMSYLAEMKYVHRDLAARNILLTKDLICKISDFGLTRDVYRDGEYFRTSRGELPIKWIAFESLCTDSYSTKSDVWSFGILLWELITFGSNPYPGLQLRDIYNFLKEGNRMEKPEGCSDNFYKIMLSCWEEDPADRPNFQDLVDLVDIFDGMLSAGTDYLQCNNEDHDGYLIPRSYKNHKHSDAEN